MIKVKELRVGLFIWWESYGPGSPDPCPGVVTFLDKSTFRVKTLDDFEETDTLGFPEDPDGFCESMRNMRKCTQKEVDSYLEAQKQKLADEAKAAQRAYERKADIFADFVEASRNFLETLE